MSLPKKLGVFETYEGANFCNEDNRVIEVTSKVACEIVRRYNAHEALVEALRGVCDCIADELNCAGDEDIKNDLTLSDHQRQLDKARKALAEAGEVTP